MRWFGVFLGVLLGSISGAAVAATPDSASSTYQINPAHDGVATFSTPFAPPLKLKWSVGLSGVVTYPVVVDNLVIVLGNAGNSLPMAAYNIATGKLAWHEPIAGGYFPGSYLASDGGTVFVATAFKPLQAFQAKNGLNLWTSKAFGSSSDIVPVAVDGYVFGGSSEDGTIVFRLSEKNGAAGWTQLVAGGGVSPTLGGGNLYFPAPCDVPAYNAISGGKLWDFNTGCDGGGGAVAAYYQQRLYAPGVYSHSGVIMDAESGKLLGPLSVSYTPTFYKQTMIAVSGTGIVATDLTTGNIAWYFAPTDNFSEAPITINGNVYALSDSGKLYILAGKTGALLQSIKVCASDLGQRPDEPYRGLGVGQHTLFVPCGTKLTAFAP